MALGKYSSFILVLVLTNILFALPMASALLVFAPSGVAQGLLGFLIPLRGFKRLEQKLNDLKQHVFAEFHKVRIVFEYGDRVVAVLPVYVMFRSYVRGPEDAEVIGIYFLTSLEFSASDLIGIGFESFKRQPVRSGGAGLDPLHVNTKWMAMKPPIRYPLIREKCLDFYGDLMWYRVGRASGILRVQGRKRVQVYGA